MSTFVYMKVLESAPERYDRGIRLLSGGVAEIAYRRIAERVAAPGKKVLDVGCGTGGVALACAARGAVVFGVDRDPGMLTVARAKAERHEIAGSVTWIELGAMELEDRFAAGELDAVVSCLAFSELAPEERRYVLRTAHGLLRPGGRIVVADEVAPSSTARRWWRQLRRLPVAVLTWVLTQTSTRPVAGLAEALRDAGFVEVREERLGHDDFALVEGVRDGAAAP